MRRKYTSMGACGLRLLLLGMLAAVGCGGATVEDLDGVSGKIFHVDSAGRSFELLKETVFDPQTDEGKSRHRVFWTDDTAVTRIVHQRDFSGLPGGVVMEVCNLNARNKALADSGKAFVLQFARVFPECDAPSALKSKNVVGRFTRNASDARNAAGVLNVDGRDIPVTLSRRRKDITVHTSLDVKSLARGFWKTTLYGAVKPGRFVVDRMDVTPLVDPRTVDDPSLPRVLVVGDSISMNYHNAAKAALKGVANYYRVEGNGGPSDRGVSSMELWLGDYKRKGLHWDLIQFNHGLHDLKQQYDKETDTWGAHQLDIRSYQRNLEKEIQVMKKTGAVLMWCSTTPVPQDNKGRYGRRKGAAALFNQAALEVVKKHPEILINDLHTFIDSSKAFDKWRKGTDVHFWSKDLQQIVGAKVAEAIKAALKATADSSTIPSS